MELRRAAILGRIHWVPVLNLVYLNNAKAGCSTIKKSLWLASDARYGRKTYDASPNDRARGPFSRNLNDLRSDDEFEGFFSSKFFSVVRNPFVRILSSYLNKVRKGAGDRPFWRKFTAYFELAEDADLSFIEFLNLVSMKEPVELDWHLCPQAVNLLCSVSPIDFVGRLEEMKICAGFLEENGVELHSHMPHQTKAQDLVNVYYGPAEAKAVIQYYADDFRFYGYSTNPNQLAPIRPALTSDSRSNLRKVLESM